MEHYEPIPVTVALSCPIEGCTETRTDIEPHEIRQYPDEYTCEAHSAPLIVTDTEGLPSDLDLIDIDNVIRYAELTDQWNAIRQHAFLVWANDNHADTVEDSAEHAVERFEESYQGTYDSFREYAEQLADTIGLFNDCSELHETYFDWYKWVRDIEYDYSTCAAPNFQTHIFRNL